MKKPSISELLKLLDKPALLNWANKQGLKGIDINEARKGYLNAGSSIHNQIEKFQKEGKPFESPETQELYLNFIKGKEILQFEAPLENQYFTGRIDLRYRYEGEIYIVDYKSNQTGIYLENKLQLCAYNMAFPSSKFGIVSVPDFTFIPVDIPNTQPYEEILRALSTIYACKQRI